MQPGIWITIGLGQIRRSIAVLARTRSRSLDLPEDRRPKTDHIPTSPEIEYNPVSTMLVYSAETQRNPAWLIHALRPGVPARYGVSQVDEAHTCRASGTSMTLRTV